MPQGTILGYIAVNALDAKTDDNAPDARGAKRVRRISPIFPTIHQ